MNHSHEPDCPHCRPSSPPPFNGSTAYILRAVNELTAISWRSIASQERQAATLERIERKIEASASQADGWSFSSPLSIREALLWLSIAGFGAFGLLDPATARALVDAVGRALVAKALGGG